VTTVLDLSLLAHPEAPDAQDTLVSLVLPDPYGTLLIRQQFDLHRGQAYFTVEKGARASGTFTVCPYQWGQAAIPAGVGVWYGRGDGNVDKWSRTERPWVNGIELVDGTHWNNPEDWSTFRPVENVHARTPAKGESTVHVPDRTQHRAGTIVLALLGHYMTHPLRPVLQRAFAEYIAGRRLDDLAASERHVRSKITAKQEAIQLLEDDLGRYARLAVELRDLANNFDRRSGAGLVVSDGGAA
jgi:hypothetical protein